MTVPAVGIKRLRDNGTDEPLNWVVTIGMFGELSVPHAIEYADEIREAADEAARLNAKRSYP